MRKIELILAKLALIVASLALAFALVEAAANYWLWNIATTDDFNLLASVNQINERYGESTHVLDHGGRVRSYSPHHYLGYVPAPDFKNADRHHNHLGFRGGPISAENPAGIYRIVAVGGSTTYSVHTEDDRDSYPHLLGEHLHASGFSNVEVINAGVPGYTSYHNFMNVAFRVLPLRPDLIILYQGFNDIDARFVYPHSRYRGDNSGAEAPSIAHQFMPAIWEYSTALRILGIRAGYISSHGDLDLIGNRSADGNFALDFKRQVNRRTYPSGIFNEISAERMLAGNPPIHFERNLLNTVLIATGNDIDILLVTMANSIDFHERTQSAKSRFYSNEVFISAMAQHNDITRRIAESTGAAIFDLAAAFPDDPWLFTDGLHMNADGNRSRAQLIGDFVIREFLSPE